MTDTSVRSDDVERVAALVLAHEQAAAVSAFVYDVVGAQAEGRSLFAGQKFMTQRAADHGVTREAANTVLGNVLSILERGPADRSEYGLLSAFAAHGLSLALADESESARAERLRRFVTHLEWLESATPYRIMPLVERLLPDALREKLYEVLGTAVLREDTADPAVDVAIHVRNAVRLLALSRASSGSAALWLGRIRKQAKDPVTRASAAVALGEKLPDPSTEQVRIFGDAAAISRRPGWAVLRWATGLALVQWVYRFACFVLRVQRKVEVELLGPALRVRRRTLLLGRTVSRFDGLYALDRVSAARRLARFALLRTLLGALALSFGVLLGGHLAFDAARGGASALLALAAVVVVLGSGLDLTLAVLMDGTRGRVEVQLDLRDDRTVRLAGVSLAEADRFLAALAVAITR